MVSHKIGVLGEVNGLQGQAPKPLPAINGLVLGRGSTSAAGLTTPFRHAETPSEQHNDGPPRRDERRRAIEVEGFELLVSSGEDAIELEQARLRLQEDPPQPGKKPE